MIVEVDVDDSEHEYVFKYAQDVEPIIEQNKRLQTDGDGYSPSRTFKHLATIPDIIMMMWAQEDGVDLDLLRRGELKDYLMRKLRDPDWRYLRTSGGSL